MSDARERLIERMHEAAVQRDRATLTTYYRRDQGPVLDAILADSDTVLAALGAEQVGWLDPYGLSSPYAVPRDDAEPVFVLPREDSPE